MIMGFVASGSRPREFRQLMLRLARPHAVPRRLFSKAERRPWPPTAA